MSQLRGAAVTTLQAAPGSAHAARRQLYAAAAAGEDASGDEESKRAHKVAVTLRVACMTLVSETNTALATALVLLTRPVRIELGNVLTEQKTRRGTEAAPGRKQKP